MKHESDSPNLDPPTWPEHPSRHARRRKQFMDAHRPPWWPENEPWPPNRHFGRPRHRSPFLRRIGCLFVALNFLGTIIFIGAFLLLLNFLGVIHLPTDQFSQALPIGGILLGLVITLLIMASTNLRRLSGPLDDLLNASNRVAEGDYSARVDESGPSEVRSLVRAFNSMAARLGSNDQQRKAMLADISHELRTPLTIIRGNVEGVLDGLYPVDEARLKSLLEETDVLTRLVDDLRTLALAESGALQLKREPTDIAALIRETVAAFRSQADAAGVRIELSLNEASPVEVDPARVREVLTNLISNALRYTPRGETVSVRYENGTISVEDRGPGISPADLPHVFDRFYKSGDSGGMGLGLSIAKYLVEAHGGEIRAESQPGRGARISFTLAH